MLSRVMAGPMTAVRAASMSNSAGGGKANPPSTRTDPATRSGARALARAVTNAPIE